MEGLGGIGWITIFCDLVRLPRKMDTVLHRSSLMSTEQNRKLSHAVQTVGKKLMGFIRARVSSQADAEDVLQEVWQQLATTLQVGPCDEGEGPSEQAGHPAGR